MDNIEITTCPVCSLPDRSNKLDDISNEQDKLLVQRATRIIQKRMRIWNFFTGKTLAGKIFSGEIVIIIPAIIFFCVCAFIATPISEAFAEAGISENILIWVALLLFPVVLLTFAVIAYHVLKQRFLGNIPGLFDKLAKGDFYYCGRDDIIFDSITRKYAKPESFLDLVEK